MKNKHVMALVVAGAALAAAAWFSSREKAPATSARIGAILLPGLDINAVDSIEIVSATETTRVTRAESGWQLPDRYYYPANFETIRQLLLKLESLKIGQALTASGAQREQVELSTPASTVLRLTAGGHPVAELTLGAVRNPQGADAGPYGFGSMPDGRFVAVNSDPAVYLVSDSLHEVSTSPQRWMDSTLLDVSPDAVTAVSLENPDDGVFTLRKGQDGAWDFDPAKEATPFDNTKSFTLTGALSYLTMQDVADPVRTDAELGFAGKPRRFRVDTKDGTFYDLLVGEPASEDGDRHIRITVGFHAPPIIAFEGGDEAQAKAADSILAAEDAQNKAAALHARLSPWTFRIPSYKANPLASSRDSLVKKPETPAENSGSEEKGTDHGH